MGSTIQLTPADRFEDHTIQDGHFLVRKAGKSLPIAVEDLFATLCIRMPPQAFGKSFRDHRTQIHIPAAGDPLGLCE
ncbi:MAG TPA: hypothetical protein VIX89_19400 [Bryobacteraceae bacterium]